MKTYEIFCTHKLKEGEKYDFFIYSPHSGCDAIWLDFIKKSLINKNFDDEILFSYMKHEADIGTREISLGIFEKIKNNHKNIKFCVILGLIPRAFCDLNRTFDRACPENVDSELWQKLYDDSISEINNLILSSRYGLHLHTMNSRNNISDWQFKKDKSQDNLADFLNNGYTGEKRNDNILTSDTNGNYFSYSNLDNIFINNWNRKNKTIDRNIAYQLEKYYPATNLILQTPSSLIEIIKGNMATNETKDIIDSSKIVLDKNKTNDYANLIVDSIVEFLG